MTKLQLIPADAAALAPAWSTVAWFNTREAPRPEALRGRVVVLHAFQMLCPGCVSHGIPQAQRIQATFAPEDVCVVGLHSVFEHHEAMRPVSLEAFLHEYRVTFPVAVDAPGDASPIPKTMAAYEMRGTPTLVLIDKAGRLRLHVFGRPDDMAVGAAVASLVAEQVDDAPPGFVAPRGDETDDPTRCDPDGCRL